MASICKQTITLFFKSVLILFFHLRVELSSGPLAKISNLIIARILPILHACYIPSPFRLTSFYRPNDIRHKNFTGVYIWIMTPSSNV